ncbi:dual specificity protein phosphatase family protein [Flavobacterium sp. ZB4P13]|uniref:dual specificity protein phosphatase family protein n=1 Tax=Flavobacterium sp. ZB4P13 TaxID=3401728 RepID=UPI003AAB127C
MKKAYKRIGGFLVLFSLCYIAAYLYDIHLNYNFKEIATKKVYKSGVIPPDQIKDYVQKYKIKSIIDLRIPGTNDLKLNPEVPGELQAEKNAVTKIKGLNYFSNPSDQIPSQKNIDYFLEIMDNPANYPVLIHCHHGTGRAILYSAIYRIEFENSSNEQARLNTRDLVLFSSFDNGTPKGEYLKAYVSRNRVVAQK